MQHLSGDPTHHDDPAFSSVRLLGHMLTPAPASDIVDTIRSKQHYLAIPFADLGSNTLCRNHLSKYRAIYHATLLHFESEVLEKYSEPDRSNTPAVKQFHR